MKMFSFISLAVLLFISTVNSADPKAKTITNDANNDKAKEQKKVIQQAEKAYKNLLAQHKELFKEIGIDNIEQAVKKLFDDKTLQKVLDAIKGIKSAEQKLKKLDPESKALKTSCQLALFPSLIALSVVAVALFV